MKSRDIIRRAGRSLKQAKVRTLLTSFAIAVGAFTLTLAIAAGEGARQYADNLIGSNINPQSIFITKDDSAFNGPNQSSGLTEYDENSINQGFGDLKQLTARDISALQERDDLENVQPLYQLSIQYLRLKGSDKKLSGSVSTYDPTLRSESLNGDLPPLGQAIGDTQIVVPEDFAQSFVNQKLVSSVDDLIGKKIILTAAKSNSAPTEDEIKEIIARDGPDGLLKLADGETKDFAYTVSAISKKSSTTLVDNASFQIASSQAKAISEYTTKGTDQYQKYPAVSALAKDAEPEVVKNRLQDDGFSAQTAKDLQQLLFTIVNILQGIVAGFGILALFASVFGIINTQYISVLERTQQIGLMKALGMRGREVARLFRYEAAWIGFLGGVIGSGAAFITGTALNPWISEKISLGEGNSLLVFQWLPIIILILVLMLIAVLAGYFPARKAAKLDPIEALRTE